MALSFRFATEEDVAVISAIEADTMSNPWKAQDYLEAIHSDHAFIAVAVNDAELVAFGVFYLTPPEAELPDIVVKKDFRGQGIGKALLTYALDVLKNEKVDTVFLEVRVSNARAQGLYISLGFEEIGKRKYFYSNPTEDAICMSLHMGD
ncbi:MAG: ribosomal-protein-alanine N-acetyltransferase [Pseudobutyrivibrio ruminis]|nr:ribosomal-protein-alanine N-acetyltransferase [Pseudobutyrivibrio ruminis]